MVTIEMSSRENHLLAAILANGHIITAVKKQSTIRWTKRMQLQLQLKLSSMKTKAIQTWTCVRLLLEWGRHPGVSVESVWRKFAQRRRRHVDLQLSRSTCQCFQASSFSYVLLDGVDRLFGHVQAPSKMSHPATVSGNLLFFSTCASFLESMDRSVTIVCIFSTHFLC